PATESEIADWREEQFQRAGKIVAHYSTLLVAIWDGKDLGKQAGTARVIEQRQRGRMLNDDDEPVSGNLLLSGHDNDLIYEIRCSRRSNSDGPVPGAPQVIGYVSHEIKNRRETPQELEAMLSRTAEFNRDVDKHRSRIEKNGW